LRAGDEAAFVALVDRHSSWMLRIARGYVTSHAVAEEAVQDAWLSVVRAIHGFEGRSSVRTWLFVIVVNAVKRRAAKERRTVPYAEVADGSEEPVERRELADRFFDWGHPRWAGCWTSAVRDWRQLPEEHAISVDLRRHIECAADRLPAAQRTVFVLRDIEGWRARDVCSALDLSESNQRVLPHRARLKVRASLERILESEGV
jgi:RNA polymerase sigma-70 factor (ECF subfamily)